MGNYEFVEFRAEIEVSDTDVPGASLPKLEQFASDYLEGALAADIEEARLNTAEEQSYIHLFKNDDQENQ